jgi:hypothetical protein
MHHSDRRRFISVVAMRRTGLAAILLAACGISGFIVADETSIMARAPGFDTNALVRYEGQQFGVEREGWVATDALATALVKKIEAGRVSYVAITTTATGTYSSDAMFSKHVQYPGLSVSEYQGRPRNQFAYWAGGHWNNFTSTAQNSFFYLRSGSTRVLQSNGRTCVFTKTAGVC